MSRLNFKLLQQELVEATRLAFNQLRQQFKGEHFYCFALYTTEEFAYVVPTAHSEEALAEKGEEVRWSPCDWKYHCQGEQFFDRVQQRINSDPVIGIDDGDLAEKQCGRLLKTLIKALQQLDGEGFFGVGSDREQVVLLILMGDQDDILLLECAEQLNPVDVYERFAKPFRLALVGRFSEIGSRKLYETRRVCVSADGSVVASVGSCFFSAFDTRSRAELLMKRVNDTNSVMAISPDGTVAAVGWQAESGNLGGVHLWSIPNKKKLRSRFPPLPGGVWAIRFSADGQSFATCGRDRTMRIWRTADGELLREAVGNEARLETIEFSPDLRWLAAIDREPNSLRVWSVDSGELVTQLNDCGDTVSFSSDSALLAVGSGYAAEDSRDVRLWNWKQQCLLQRIEGLVRSAHRVRFGLDDRCLAIGTTFPGITELWDNESHRRLLSLDPNYERINDLAFLKDNKTIAVAGCGLRRPPVLLWDISDATNVDASDAPPL